MYKYTQLIILNKNKKETLKMLKLSESIYYLLFNYISRVSAGIIMLLKQIFQSVQYGAK